jgi:hypothetical protein
MARRNSRSDANPVEVEGEQDVRERDVGLRDAAVEREGASGRSPGACELLVRTSVRQGPRRAYASASLAWAWRRTGHAPMACSKYRMASRMAPRLFRALRM